jgi:hypothetical protein
LTNLEIQVPSNIMLCHASIMDGMSYGFAQPEGKNNDGTIVVAARPF